MQVVLQRRAEIAIRSLTGVEQKRIHRALAELSTEDRAFFSKSRKTYRLATGFSGKQLFAYRVGPNLRLILSFERDTCIIEDVVDHDRLEWLRLGRDQG